jgi:hypothetical protein
MRSPLSLCLHIHMWMPSSVARQWLGKNVSAVVRVVSKESRQLSVMRIFFFIIII